MTFEEFHKEVRKANTKKEFKITNSFGAYDIYKNMRKHKWYDIGRPVLEKEYYSIIKEMNSLFKEELSKGQDFVLPYKMGRIEVRKVKNGAWFEDGKLIVSYPTDWKSTLELWYNDEEAKRNKKLIKNSNVKYSYKVIYNNMRKADFTNTGLFQISPSKDLRLKIMYNSFEDKIDAFKNIL